ncbi:MAG: hypothetical protein ACI8QT_001736 [Halioglobus sp.]|jgi:hypothetical protein
MNNFTIIGAGQAGLQLGIGLLQAGHKVRVVTNRTAEQVACGGIMSSQCMFDTALSYERDLGLNYWDESCPNVNGIGLTIDNPDPSALINWAARLEAPAQSVDQRVKMPRWMQRFEELGGELVICDAGIEELEAYAAESDLVLVASGKGEVGRLFERDAQRSAFDRPMRALGLTYVNGMRKDENFSKVGFNIAPGVGEYFSFPALTTTGPCDIMVFEGVPEGEMDCWGEVDSPQAHLQMSKDILARHFPLEAARCEHVELTDDNGILAGRFPPTIKKPVGRLPSGALVMGIGDTVCLNDPITGQGSNNASKASRVYLDAILARVGGEFDEDWMSATFESFWDIAQYIVQWTNSLLLPPPEHALAIYALANDDRETAERFANGFDDARDYFPWFMDSDAAQEWVASRSL